MKDTKERKHEIKKVLLNNLILTDDKKLAVGPDIRVTLWGVGDGAGETFAFGVKKKVYAMEADYANHTQAIYNTSETMKDMGRILKLETVDSEACVLIRHFFFRPVVLVLEEEQAEDIEEGSEPELILSAYSGRALLTSFSINHAVKELEKMSDGKIRRYSAPKE